MVTTKTGTQILSIGVPPTYEANAIRPSPNSSSLLSKSVGQRSSGLDAMILLSLALTARRQAASTARLRLRNFCLSCRRSSQVIIGARSVRAPAARTMQAISTRVPSPSGVNL